MPMARNSDTRVTYEKTGSFFMFALVLFPLGAVAVFCLRSAWVMLFLRDGWPVSVGFAAFAALMIWMIIKYGWSIYGPSMILTPTQITIPGAFRSRRYAITPDTQVIRWDRRFTKRETHKVGESSQKMTFEKSYLVMADTRAVLLSSVRYGSGAVERRTEDLLRVAGIRVQNLTPGGIQGDPIPPMDQWSKRDP